MDPAEDDIVADDEMRAAGTRGSRVDWLSEDSKLSGSLLVKPRPLGQFFVSFFSSILSLLLFVLSSSLFVSLGRLKVVSCWVWVSRKGEAEEYDWG